MNKSKKVLYVITKNDVGGAQKYVHDLAANLDKKRFEAKIIYGGQDIQWLSNKTYPWLLFINDWLAVLELIKIFKREQPDVIHLNSSKAGVIGSLAAWLYKTLLSLNPIPYLPDGQAGTRYPKVVFTAHGWVFNPTNDISWLVKQFYISLHKLAAKFQDRIICVSEYDYNLALCYSIAPKEKLVAIHNGIDPNIEFLDKDVARKQLLSYAGAIVNESGDKNSSTHKLINSTWVGSIGRLVKEKNYETFVVAAAKLLNSQTDKLINFFIIGDGYEKQKLELLITSYQLRGRFFIVPPTGDDYKYLKAFDVFVLPSIKEGLPYTILEAMVAKTPVIATNVGGLPEILKDDCGVIITPRQPEKLAIAIADLLKNTKTTTDLTTKAVAKVKSDFSLIQMTEKTSNTYLLV